MNELTSLKSVERPAKPNTAYFVPYGVDTVSGPDAASPVFDVPADTLFATAIELWSGLTRVELVTRDDANRRAHFIAKTALMRFKDDISLEVVDLADGQSSVILYSASRVGYSDLGTNRKRVEQWLELLKERVERA